MTPAKRPLKKLVAPPFDLAEYVVRFTTWATTKALSDRGKMIHEKMNKDDLKPLVLKYGQINPETGSYFLEFPTPVEAGAYGKVDGVTAQASIKRVMDEESAISFFTLKSLLPEVQTTITVLDEDKVNAQVLLGKITEEEYDALYSTTTTYSFIPHKFA